MHDYPVTSVLTATVTFSHVEMQILNSDREVKHDDFSIRTNQTFYEGEDYSVSLFSAF